MELEWHKDLINHWHAKGVKHKYHAYPYGRFWNVYAMQLEENHEGIELGRNLSDFESVEREANKFEGRS
jgi:hypothetical protein